MRIIENRQEERHMSKRIISTPDAPAAIGTYSQAVKVGYTVYLAGQIGLDPETMEMAEGIEAQIGRVFENMKAVAEEAGGSLDEVVKITAFLTDLNYYAKFNEMMARYFAEPYPARVTVGVASLPREALIEVDAIMELSGAGATASELEIPK
jgi:reactive intermediate/imine deaminase